MTEKHGYVWVSAFIIVLAFIIGYAATLISKEKDTPIEQVAEAVLHSEGIDVDFSPEDEQ